MATRVAINGFGRIGRGFLRAVLVNPEVEIVAVNDLVPTATNAHLLKYDSTQGVLDLDVQCGRERPPGGRWTIKVFAERNPAELPWGDLDIDVVIESTGIFTSRAAAAAHLDRGGEARHHLGALGRRRRDLCDGRQRGLVQPRDATSSSRTPRARRTASCRWSRSSTTPSAWRPAS